MGLNRNVMSLIEAVANQDNETAKAYAKCIIANEKSEKNKQWCQKQQLKLNSTKGSFITLPLNISDMCDLVYNEMEFNIDRYYLREEEKKLVDKILTRRKTCIKAQAMGVNMPNSTLLYGVPGCGKSLFANYISYITKTPLLTVRFSEMIDSRLGKTSNNIGKIFDFANKNDAIIFLDEIDTVARKRTSESGSDGELSRVTVTLMQELDKLKRGTIVIAATNRKDMLDEALFRRFSLIQEISLPTKQDKINMVHKWWKSINMDIPFSAETYVDKFSTLSDIDRDMVDVLAKMLDTEEVTVKEGKCLSNVDSWIKDVFREFAKSYQNKKYTLDELLDDREYMYNFYKSEREEAKLFSNCDYNAVKNQCEEAVYVLRDAYMRDFKQMPSINCILELI